MGFEWVDRFEDDEIELPPAMDPHGRIQQVINLMDDDDDDLYEESKRPEKSSDDADPWTENALRIQSDLHRMARWILSKQYDYVGLNMPDDEASLIQSTVTSFAATTASELETLRKLIPDTSSTLAGHRNGIVQILLSELQEKITQPFGILQKQRTRISVQLWQHPWQCQLVIPQSSKKGGANSMMQQLFDEGDDDNNDGATRDKRFMPRSAVPPVLEVDFWNAYERDPLAQASPKPDFLERLAVTRQRQADTEFASSRPTELRHSTMTPTTPRIIPTTPSNPPLPFQEQQQQEFDELQEEAAQLQVTIVQSDLDSVQKMEQRMVEITTLIGQFSSLVSEQQEEILDIAQHAQETKQNMTKGQENLVDATERTKRSKHYLAWTIFGLSMTLLFFHTLRG